MEMPKLETSKSYLSTEDSIEQLRLNRRTHHALARAGVLKIKNLLEALEANQIRQIKGIGELGIRDIENTLAHINIINHNLLENEEVNKYRQLSLVINWQIALIEKQVESKILHTEAIVLGKSLHYWISNWNNLDPQHTYYIFGTVIANGINICDELSFLLNNLKLDQVSLLIARFGFEEKTLEQIGEIIGVTRERVRQKQNRILDILLQSVSSCLDTNSTFHGTQPNLIRIKTALLIAKDLEMNISFSNWRDTIITSGLLGTWVSKKYLDLDPIETMLAVCRAVKGENLDGLGIPQNLEEAIRLASSGRPHTTAKEVYYRKNVSPETKNLIKRHYIHSGAVNVRWLSDETHTDLDYMNDLLQALGYKRLVGDWFLPRVDKSKLHNVTRQVFHRSIRKMSQFCGPLPLQSICSGLRNSLSRTNFPVPPPKVMEVILKNSGYSTRGGLYFWDGPMTEELSESEKVIYKCFEQGNIVVHHSELAQAFITSQLSFPSLHMALRHSPVFEKIGKGLYTVRGTSYTQADIIRAEEAADRVHMDVDVHYDRRGLIEVSFNMGILVIATGTATSEHFPKLDGEWMIDVHEKQQGTLRVVDNEFRHLRKAVIALGCDIGDRIKLIFNTWDRSVSILKLGTSNEN